MAYEEYDYEEEEGEIVHVQERIKLEAASPWERDRGGPRRTYQTVCTSREAGPRKSDHAHYSCKSQGYQNKVGPPQLERGDADEKAKETADRDCRKEGRPEADVPLDGDESECVGAYPQESRMA